MHKFLYYITYGALWLLTLLPLRILYVFSSINAFFLHYVIRYRHSTMKHNLTQSFPDKSPKEIRRIMRQNYVYLCDVGMESLKLMNISPKTMQKHFQLENLEAFEEFKNNNTHAVGLIAHYGAWEWIPSTALALDHSMVFSSLYKAIKNTEINELFLKIRSQFGLKLYDKNKVLRAVLTLEKENKPYLLAFVADQKPKSHDAKTWVNFLGQETAFFTGWYRIAERLNLSVYYFDIRRLSRGHYTARFEQLTDDVSKYTQEELVQRYASSLEKTILRNPSYWLWSHHRWQYTRDEDQKAHTQKA